MPIIDEIEQQNYVGGTFYFDSYDNYLTQQGPSNDIKIASDINNLDSTTALNDNPDEVLEAVFQSMAGGIGFSGDVEVEDLGHAKYGEARNGKIIMNVLSPSFGPNGQNNFFDFMCTLIHEKHHLDSPHDADSDESEYYAYRAVLQSPAFSNASDEYKTHAINAFNHYRDKLGY
ncbi:hypothetical protein [Proteiniphilum propionicum]|jgi:hypothetical protein|nr:hypothetical protein [Proteiniphilum propionicum]MDD4438343.1 hypothetical protein [Tissierellia bacterium]ULB34364.1 hypothetical protein KDN43_15645 [Proteiniphilum propionicum]